MVTVDQLFDLLTDGRSPELTCGAVAVKILHEQEGTVEARSTNLYNQSTVPHFSSKDVHVCGRDLPTSDPVSF
uniref:Uncharacterized protein n=1 Tax=Setaria italica TaxID=4555 RepID=K4A404_SETIT